LLGHEAARRLLPGIALTARALEDERMILFVRHAESVSNAGGITMPHEAIPLSEMGRQQAQALAASLPAAPAAVLVSGMIRTHETAAPYCARHGVSPREHRGLNEFSVIDERLIAGMDGPQRREYVRDYWVNPDPHRRWGEKADTFLEFQARVQGFSGGLDGLEAGTVIFGHGIWLMLLHWLLRGNVVRTAADMRGFRQFALGLPMPNCAVFRVSPAGAGWNIQALQ
jgi:alpha-ribazole phosphatase